MSSLLGQLMDTSKLIHSIVRGTGALIARLATASGSRASLSGISDRFFSSIVAELEAQNIRQKVIADMFGIPLRSFQYRMSRLSRSRTDSGRLLWEVIFEFLQTKPEITLGQVLTRFYQEDEATVRGLLGDLVDSGLADRSGRGPTSTYSLATSDHLDEYSPARAERAREALVGITIFREGPISRTELADRLNMSDGDIAEALGGLAERNQLGVSDRKGEARYSLARFVMPIGASGSAEAAVYDHFQAVFETIATRVAPTGDFPTQEIGGSTYSFDIWPGHAEEASIRSLLSEIRSKVSAIGTRALAFESSNERPRPFKRVTFYVGQVSKLFSFEDSE